MHFLRMVESTRFRDGMRVGVDSDSPPSQQEQQASEEDSPASPSPPAPCPLEHSRLALKRQLQGNPEEPSEELLAAHSPPASLASTSAPRPLRTWRITPSGLVPVSAETMGAFLDKPKTAKDSTAGEGKGLRYAVASMQGWRIDMEDAHVVKISMSDADPMRDWSFFAVFDGHAGSLAAEDAAERILHTLLEMPHFAQATEQLTTNGGVLCQRTQDLLEAGIKAGFLQLDEKIREKITKTDRSGSTAVCAIVTPSHIILANLGDSRAVVSKKGERPLGTEDHKPTVDRERERIVNAGGSVMIQRINGSLAVSRALGDFEYKATVGLAPARQQVSAEPDVYFIDREKEKDEFLVLACDGIYDVMSNDELCQFIESRIECHGEDLQKVCNQVLDACLQKGSRDNMTFLLICFEGAPTLDAHKAAAHEERTAAIIKALSTIIDDEMDAERLARAEDVSPDYAFRALCNKHADLVPEGHARLLIRSLVETVIADKDAAAGRPPASPPAAPSSLAKKDRSPTPSTPSPPPSEDDKASSPSPTGGIAAAAK